MGIVHSKIAHFRDYFDSRGEREEERERYRLSSFIFFIYLFCTYVLLFIFITLDFYLQICLYIGFDYLDFRFFFLQFWLFACIFNLFASMHMHAGKLIKSHIVKIIETKSVKKSYSRNISEKFSNISLTFLSNSQIITKSVKLCRNFDSIRSDPFSIPLRNTKLQVEKKIRENDLEYQHISS